MDPDKFRIVTLDSKVSEDIFTLVRVGDKRNLLVVENESGNRVTIHQGRILDLGAQGRAVILRKGEAVNAVCPMVDCARVMSVTDGKISCPEHGEFETVDTRPELPMVNTVECTNTKTDRRQTPMTETIAEPQAGNTVDLAEIAKFGSELWTKPRLNFDHVTMDVKAHVLIADDPVRKLCFNTYNGTLGKKKKVEDLHLPEFKAGEPTQGKKLWHILKGSLDDARQHLSRKGYQRA